MTEKYKINYATETFSQIQLGFVARPKGNETTLSHLLITKTLYSLDVHAITKYPSRDG